MKTSKADLESLVKQLQRSEGLQFLALAALCELGLKFEKAPSSEGFIRCFPGEDGELYTLHLMRPFAVDGGIILTLVTQQRKTRLASVEYAEDSLRWARLSAPRDFEGEGARRRDSIYQLISERNAAAIRLAA